MPSLHVIYASTSGHTEYVVDELIAALGGKVTVEKQRVELAKPEDLARGDVLLLASGTWNTGGAEGQLNPYMHFFLRGAAKDVDLAGKKVLVIGLGDARYHFTARAHDLLVEYVKSHGGTVIEPTLKIINEPYGQEEKVKEWAKAISSHLAS